MKHVLNFFGLGRDTVVDKGGRLGLVLDSVKATKTEKNDSVATDFFT